MKWNRRSSIAFAAAALLTGAGVAVVANATSDGTPAGTTSVTEPVSTASPTSSSPAMVEDSTGPGASGSDDAAAVGLDDNSVDNPATHDVRDDNSVDNPATHDVRDDDSISGHGADG